MIPARTRARPMIRQSPHRRRGRPLVAAPAEPAVEADAARAKREAIIAGSWRAIPVSWAFFCRVTRVLLSLYSSMLLS